MAESTLSITYAGLKEAIAYYLGYGRTSGNWTTRQTANIVAAGKRGMREFYYPMALPGENVPHEWTFLRPSADLVIWPTTTTAAITVSGAGSTILTAASGTPFYPSMVGKTIVSDTLGNSYMIASYTSATVVVVTADASADTGDTFTITADGDYRLPDDFQAVQGPFTFTSSTASWYPLDISNEATIRRLRANQSAVTGIPQMSAIEAEAYDSVNPTRWRLMVYPIPGAVYTLRYKYTRAPNLFTSDTDYPPGGAQHTQTAILMCEAAADREVLGQPGAKEADAMRAMVRSIQADRVSVAPENMGPMLDPCVMRYDGRTDNDLRPGVTLNIL